MTKKFIELTDDDLDALGEHALRDAYKLLRAHHIEETSALITKLATARGLLWKAGHVIRETCSRCRMPSWDDLIARCLSEGRTQESDPSS